MIFGMGPIEFLIVCVIVLVPLLIVLNATLKESPVPGQPTPQEANLVSRLWWLYSLAFRNLANVSGRASLREFWTFTLINAVIGNVISGIEVALGLAPSFDEIGIIYGIFAFIVFIPTVTVTVRRLHDGGRSGWWLLIALVPLVGWIVALYQLVGRGTQGDNRFGSDPRERSANLDAQVDASESA